MRYLIILVVFLFVGCAGRNPYLQFERDLNDSNAALYEVMGWVLTAKPQVDAYSAFRDGESKFYAIQQHHRVSIPVYEIECSEWRVRDSEISEVRDKTLNTRVKYIEGAGYGAETYEHRKLNAIAELYIETYNSTLLFHLQNNNQFECL